MEQLTKIILQRDRITLEITARQPVSLTAMEVYKLGGNLGEFNCGFSGGGAEKTAQALHYLLFGRIGSTAILSQIVKAMPNLGFGHNESSCTTFDYTPFQLAYGTKYSDKNPYGENPIRPFETIAGIIQLRSHPNALVEHVKPN